MVKQFFTDAWTKVKPFLAARGEFFRANAGDVLFWVTMGVSLGWVVGLIFK